MKISPNFKAFNFSAKGMSLEKKKMDLIAENIANINTTRTENGTAYKRKYLRINDAQSFDKTLRSEQVSLKLKTGDSDHLGMVESPEINISRKGASEQIVEDKGTGETVFMPDHPDADENGYVEMPNINVVNEMVDMIASTRGYEANLEAFNASKQIAKDSLEI